MTHVFYHPYKFPKFRNILAIKTSTASFKDTFSRIFDDHCRSFKIEASFLGNTKYWTNRSEKAWKTETLVLGMDHFRVNEQNLRKFYFSNQIFHSHENVIYFRVFFIFQGLIHEIKSSKHFLIRPGIFPRSLVYHRLSNEDWV